MICYRCRKKIADDAKFCPECGTATRLVGEAPTETIILPPDFGLKIHSVRKLRRFR